MRMRGGSRSPINMSGGSFYVADVEDQTEASLAEALQAERAVITTWELGESLYRYAEVFYKSKEEAEQAYYKHIVNTRLLHKESNTAVWLSGLPAVVSARDLFTSLRELTPGLLSISVPRNPE